jgi:hypothetical protein
VEKKFRQCLYAAHFAIRTAPGCAVFTKFFTTDFSRFHKWKTRRFLSVSTVESVVAFLWLGLAALRVCAGLCFPSRRDFSAETGGF